MYCTTEQMSKFINVIRLLTRKMEMQIWIEGRRRTLWNWTGIRDNYMKPWFKTKTNFLALSAERARNNDTLVTRSVADTRILISLAKETRLPWRNGWFWLRVRKVQSEPGACYIVPESKEVLKTRQGYDKRTQKSS